MTPTTTDMVLWGCAAAIALAEALLLAWFIRGDRSRGRRRCPRCWYAMEGAPTLTCPECGHDARRERRLLRTRRSWRGGTVGAVLAVLAGGVGAAPVVRHKGWRESVPDAILVTVWPMSAREWMNQKLTTKGVKSKMFDELDRRIARNELGDWSSRWWTDRAVRYLERTATHGVVSVSDVLDACSTPRVTHSFNNERLVDVFATLETQVGVPFTIDWDGMLKFGVRPDTRLTMELNHATGLDAVDRIRLGLGRAGVIDIGFGIDPDCVIVDDSYDIPRRTQTWPIGDVIDHFVLAVERLNRSGTPMPPSTVAVASFTPAELRRQHAGEICRLLKRTLDDAKWVDRDGSAGTMYFIDDRLFVRCPAQNMPLIDSCLAALREALDRSAPAGLVVSLEPSEWQSSIDILKSLSESRVTLPSSSPTARQVALVVGRATGVPVDLDWSGLAAKGRCDSPLLSGPESTTAAEALDRLTASYWTSRDVGLAGGWTVWRGAVRIFRDDRARACSLWRIYRVEDIIDAPLPTAPAGGVPQPPSGPLAALAQTVATTIDPVSWIDSGGEAGSIWELGSCLVIKTTVTRHLKIEELFANLRVKQQSTGAPASSR